MAVRGFSRRIAHVAKLPRFRRGHLILRKYLADRSGYPPGRKPGKLIKYGVLGVVLALFSKCFKPQRLPIFGPSAGAL